MLKWDEKLEMISEYVTAEVDYRDVSRINDLNLQKGFVLVSASGSFIDYYNGENLIGFNIFKNWKDAKELKIEIKNIIELNGLYYGKN